MKQEQNAPDLEKFLKQERGPINQPPEHAASPYWTLEYVASPYWHPRAAVRQARAQAALAGTILLIERHVAAPSPVVYSASIQAQQENTSPPAGWYDFDLHFLAAAKGLTILEIPGWENSKGILIELSFALGRGLPISQVQWPEIRERLNRETLEMLENPDQQVDSG